LKLSKDSSVNWRQIFCEGLMGCGFGVLARGDVDGSSELQRPRSSSIVSISARRGYTSALKLFGRTGSAHKRVLKIEPYQNNNNWIGSWNVPFALLGSASDECCRALAVNLVPHVIYTDEVCLFLPACRILFDRLTFAITSICHHLSSHT
jgi:hypothetical protein